MTDEEKAEEITCKKFHITKNVLKSIMDGLIGRTYYERDIFNFYNGILVGLAEGRKEICKKILEETKKMWQEDSDYFSDLEGIIKNLGVEV